MSRSLKIQEMAFKSALAHKLAYEEGLLSEAEASKAIIRFADIAGLKTYGFYEEESRTYQVLIDSPSGDGRSLQFIDYELS